MQQVLEFLLVLAFGVRLGGPHDAHARGFQHARDVIGGSFSSRAETRHELPPDLLDLGRSESRHGKLARDLQDQFLLGRVIRVCHGDDLTGLDLCHRRGWGCGRAAG